MIFTGCCLLAFAALSTHRLKYLGLFHMASAVLTVLNSDILPHASTGAGTRRLPIVHVVNTCDVAFWAFHAIPWILNVQRRSGSVSSRLAPGWTLGSAGPIVKLGTANITKVDHENLIFELQKHLLLLTHSCCLIRADSPPVSHKRPPELFLHYTWPVTN